MPELPEVETTRRGIEKFLKNQIIRAVVVRHWQLRWPIPKEITKDLIDTKIISIERRGKFLLLSTQKGTLIIHLGMSGCLRILQNTTQPDKHDHLDLIFDHNLILRYSDPRRFGTVLWTKGDPLDHPLLRSLGPEPLSKEFSADYLLLKSSARKIPVKLFLMDSKVVVGIGNIYANEILFEARLRPTLKTKNLRKQDCKNIYTAAQKILNNAIRAGGTTLKDFYSTEGKPGYFLQKLAVYGRENEACYRCSALIKKIILGQRSTYYCPKCQHL